MGRLQMIPVNMMVFHNYVSLLKGIPILDV